MSRRDLIFLLNLIEFLFESDNSPGANEKIKPGEFRNALSAYLDISNADVNHTTISQKNSEEEEKMKKQINSLQEQVASLGSMTEMTINYMQESISRLEQENKKIAGSIKFVEKLIESFVNSPSRIPFKFFQQETSNNQDFIATSLASKNGIFYTILIEKPFKDISKSIFSLFINYILEQTVTYKRLTNASMLLVDLETQIKLIQDKLNTSKNANINMAVCIIDKQMGDLEFASNSFPLYIWNKGNLVTFLPQLPKNDFNAERYNIDRALLRESAEVFAIVNGHYHSDADIQSIIHKDIELETKVKDMLQIQEAKSNQTAIMAIKF